MTSRQKRTLLRLLTAVVLLLVLLAAVTQVKKRREEQAQAAAASSAADTVTDADAAYRSITYSNGTATLSFALNEEDVWYWADDPEFPLDQNCITGILNIITGLKPQQTITGGDALEDYGLDEPSMTLTAAGTDGKELTLALGNQVSGDSGSYYLLIDGDESTVYVVSGTLASRLSSGIYDMMELPQTPVIQESSFRSITVQGAVETLLTPRVSGASTEADSSAGGAEETAVTWQSGGKDVTDDETARALISALSAVTLDGCVDYRPTPAAASLCGFDAPAAVAAAEYRDDSGADETLTLTVGNLTTDGASRYVRINDDTTIYSITADSLSAILSVAAGGLSA